MVMGDIQLQCEVLVIGSGPGGYAAAFRAADLGKDVTLVDTAPRLGGVCLLQGCIPSKTYLHLSELIADVARAESLGLAFGAPTLDLQAMAAWKNRVIDSMAGGLESLCTKRNIQRVQGRVVFESSRSVRLQDSEVRQISFERAVIATGSRPIVFPGVEGDASGRIMDSTAALDICEVPDSLLVIGGGYVGLELGSVYGALGSKVCLVELAERLLPGVDGDLVQPLYNQLNKRFDSILLGTRVSSMEVQQDGVAVVLESSVGQQYHTFTKVLVAIGRQPNSDRLGLEHTAVTLDERGYIVVDEQQRSQDERIFAVGDVVGGMMLAHTATREGKIAAEVLCGHPSSFDARAVPAVVFTDPQIAWCGLTEDEAERQNRAVGVKRFPWKFSGRALTMGSALGTTKILIDPESDRIVGMGIVGRNAEGLIGEGVLAIEMGALAEDLALCIHPHPTLSETEGEAAELYLGCATHMLNQE